MSDKNKCRPFTVVFIIPILLAISGSFAAAEWKAEYGNNPPEVTDWFRKAYINPQALNRLVLEIQQQMQSFETPLRPLTEADRRWMKLAKTTPEARSQLKYEFCCDHGDRVKTKFTVDRSSGVDQWKYLEPATGLWRDIPDYIVHHGNDDPSVPRMPEALLREGVLFIYQGKELCFWPPEEGG